MKKSILKHQDSDATDVSGDEQASPGVDARGIPLKSDFPEGLPVPALYVIFTTVFTTICLGIAFAIYKFGSTEKYDKKIELLTAYDLGWVYLVMFAVKLGMFGININLGVARKAAKVNVPDQQVYKVHTPDDASPLGFVLMESEGDLGRFNRAQRAYMNYLESAPLFFVYVLLAGFVFPFPTFVTGFYYAVMRIVAAVGYTQEPKGRMAGNMLGNLGSGVLEGMVIIAGVKAVMV